MQFIFSWKNYTAWNACIRKNRRIHGNWYCGNHSKREQQENDWTIVNQLLCGVHLQNLKTSTIITAWSHAAYKGVGRNRYSCSNSSKWMTKYLVCDKAWVGGTVKALAFLHFPRDKALGSLENSLLWLLTSVIRADLNCSSGLDTELLRKFL